MEQQAAVTHHKQHLTSLETKLEQVLPDEKCLHTDCICLASPYIAYDVL